MRLTDDDVCEKCNHGSDMCNGCEFYHIIPLHDKYPKETDALYHRIKRKTLKKIRNQVTDDADDFDDDDGDE
jgi:hypothetical protein